MQEMSHRPPDHWNVLSEQRNAKWQHPKTEHREETQYSATDECDTSGYPHPDRMLSTNALETTPDPGGHVILKAVHFLVEIGSSGHARSKGMHSICSNGERSRIGQGGGKRRAISRGRQLHSLGDDSWLVHTNIPSVPDQKETNDTGLAATTHNRV
jgi:hypothetical protein